MRRVTGTILNGKSTMNKQRLHRLAAILREAAPGPVHRRIQAELGDWARQKGFVEDLHTSLPTGGRPDVFRYIRADSMLFIGDAKDTENEDAFTFETYERISGYLMNFADLVADSSIKGGIFAIATDDANEANAWASRLNKLAANLGLIDGAGAAPNFQVDKIAADTWVAWW
jgi:hypothetical protein